MRTTAAAEAALRRTVEPNRPATLYRETSTQTEEANLDGANPNAQLKFQAALQTELQECQEELVKAQMQAKAMKRDKDRLAEDLEAATKTNLMQMRAGSVAVRNNHFGEGNNGEDTNGGTDTSEPRGDGPGISEEEIDETVNSLLEMITAEREAKCALEGHAARAVEELQMERDAHVAEREAHVAMQHALSAHKDATAEEFVAQEQKLREATAIMSELRQALLQVMHVKEGSVAGASARGGGGGGDAGSEGGRSIRSGRSAGSHRSRPPHPHHLAHLQYAQTPSTRPLPPAALAHAREVSRRRSEEAIQRWKARLEEGVTGVIGQVMAAASRESFGTEPDLNGMFVQRVTTAVKGVMEEVVETHMSTIVDEMQRLTRSDDARYEVQCRSSIEGKGGRSVGRDTAHAHTSSGRERLVVWMAEENMKCVHLQEKLVSAQDELARSEAGRVEATQRWLEINAQLTENGGSVRGDASDWASEAGTDFGGRGVGLSPVSGGGGGLSLVSGRQVSTTHPISSGGAGVEGGGQGLPVGQPYAHLSKNDQYQGASARTEADTFLDDNKALVGSIAAAGAAAAAVANSVVTSGSGAHLVAGRGSSLLDRVAEAPPQVVAREGGRQSASGDGSGTSGDCSGAYGDVLGTSGDCSGAYGDVLGTSGDVSSPLGDDPGASGVDIGVDARWETAQGLGLRNVGEDGTTSATTAAVAATTAAVAASHLTADASSAPRSQSAEVVAVAAADDDGGT